MPLTRLNIGDPAPDYTLLSSSGDTVYLNNVWQNGPTVLTFLRHFG